MYDYFNSDIFVFEYMYDTKIHLSFGVPILLKIYCQYSAIVPISLFTVMWAIHVAIRYASFDFSVNYDFDFND